MTFGMRMRGWGTRTLAFARRPELLAFLPAVTLAAWWMGGEGALIATALAVPLAYALAGIAGVTPAPVAAAPGVDPVTGLGLRDGVERALDIALSGRGDGAATACIVIGLDGADRLARLHGHSAFCEILARTGARLAGAVRRGDVVVRLEGACFAVALAPSPGLDLEGALQTAAHLQDTLEVDLRLDDITVALRASVGLCLAGRAADPGGAGLLAAAIVAMDAAHLHGPGAIRAYADDMRRRSQDIAELRRDLGPALDEGEVQAFFQPQISTCTHRVTGMETLVRWDHPRRGLLAPADFLPGLLAAGLADRLGEVMLSGALRALHRWDRAGHDVPTVTVNFAPEELRNPRLPERVQWELDRFGLTPDRLVIDIPEAVLAQGADEMLRQTLLRLAELGARIDLDALSGGHASVEALERFPVNRLKIAPRFVRGLDGCATRQRTVAALLALAERLDLDTLAVGVETPGDHAILAQLGCRHVQGFAIARAMPEAAATTWIATHTAGIGPPLRIGSPKP
ncbi:bifunctional diguanylate cyclase/phosphodiesterase [Rhodobaculum claviforme]|nr:bifunctional diguanylate cyclase/phosphodiesterase [Rhodobaculum claviforme]